MLKSEFPQAQADSSSGEFALWNLGFRPFYLLASSFAALSVLLWVGQYTGILPSPYLRSPAWHGHEMLYGYTMAVIAGFLLTAVRNWTGMPTPTGAALIALAALWLAGRVLVLTPFAAAAAIVNAAFPIAVAIGIGIPIVRSRNRRNYFFIALLLFLGGAVLAVHLSHMGILSWPARASLQVGLDIVLFVMAVMGGRVIPMFTNNGIPGTKAARHPLVEKLALGGVLALLGADLLQAALRSLRRSRQRRDCPCRAAVPLAAMANSRDADCVGTACRVRLDCRLPRAAWTCGIGYRGRTVRGSRADGRRDRRHDDRHDDAHGTRPYRASDCRGWFRGCLLHSRGAAAAIRVFGGMLLPGAYLATVVVSGICWSVRLRSTRCAIGRCCRATGSTVSPGSPASSPC